MPGKVIQKEKHTSSNSDVGSLCLAYRSPCCCFHPDQKPKGFVCFRASSACCHPRSPSSEGPRYGPNAWPKPRLASKCQTTKGGKSMVAMSVAFTCKMEDLTALEFHGTFLSLYSWWVSLFCLKTFRTTNKNSSDPFPMIPIKQG